jgi:WD40 repeat protein
MVGRRAEDRVPSSYFVGGNFQQDVWRMNADGSGQTFVTKGLDPSWSPDGKKIVFARGGRDNEGGGIFVNDGATETKVAPAFRDSRAPDWSPDGQRIVFTAASIGGSGAIYILNADGTGLTRISPPPGGDLDARWSPDGSQLAFQSSSFNPPDIWTMHPDGTGRTQLTNTPNEYEQLPAWSPDGQKIAIERRVDSTSYVAVMNADGSNVTNLVTGAFSPDWGPRTASYVRPRGATPTRTSLVPAFEQCTSPDDQHGAPLSFGSCNPPVQSSGFVTIGSPPEDQANTLGFVIARAIPPNPAVPQSQADVGFDVSITDVRSRPSLADYSGELETRLALRITDQNNVAAPGDDPDAATAQNASFSFALPCTTTADTSTGSSCSVSTTANTIAPGAVAKSLRTIWELGPIQVYDGGPDSVASTQGGNTLFMTQGVFVP